MFTEGGIRRRNRNAAGKWFNSAVVSYNGNFVSIRDRIPDFERRTLALTQNQKDYSLSRINPRLDLIVRKPFHDDDHYVPIGVVSKEYQLVPHKEVYDAAIEAFRYNNIDPAKIFAYLTLTEYGERMHLGFLLPKEYYFNPGDGHPMTMQLECSNSVDGSTRFKAFVDWYRLVCSNGLTVLNDRTDFHHRHDKDLRINDICAVLTEGLEVAKIDKEVLREWYRISINLEHIQPWVNNDMCDTWGFKAATRAFHIACTGADAEIIGTYKDMRPTTISVKKTKKIPGAPEQAQNAYDISQILAWLAKERNDVEERLAWRQRIPDLMKALLN